MKHTILSLLLFPLLLFGETEIWMRNQQYQQEMERQNHPIDPITPCAGPKVRGGMDLDLSAAFIYWTARLDGLTYAKSGSASSLGEGVTTQGSNQAVNWQWDPGFKVALGWSFCHGCWDMVLRYTWFYTEAEGSTNAPFLRPSLIDSSLQPGALFTTQSAYADFDLHYQMGDLELGRNFYLSSTLKCRPFIGLKGGWQKQNYNVYYDSVGMGPLQPLTNYQANFENEIYGLGMRGGIGSSWQFSKPFSLYGDIALSGMWLHYCVQRKDQFSPAPQNPQVPYLIPLNLENSLNLVKPVLEFAMGLRLESYFSCKRYHILFQVGWEGQIWINQSLYVASDHGYERYDLSFQGLTAKLRYDF